MSEVYQCTYTGRACGLSTCVGCPVEQEAEKEIDRIMEQGPRKGRRMILIEKDKAIEKTWEEPSYSDPLNVLTEIRDRLNTLPTIEIVRCRECRHWDASKNCGYCDIWDHYISNEDFYCGCGDRRNEDG